MSDDIRQNFGFVLGEVTHLWRQELDRRLRPRGLSQATWRALFHLERRGEGLSQRALAESIGIEEPTLVRLLDTLEEAELVKRRVSATDRRCKTLHLTDGARRVLEDIHQTARGVRQDLLDGLADEELRQVMSTLRRIANNAQRLKDGASPAARQGMEQS